VSDFETLQPFRTRQNAPEQEPLAVLEELWNIDKHRHLHLVQCFVGLKDVESRMPLPGIKWPEEFRHEYKITIKHAAGPFKDGAELGRFYESGNVMMGIPQVYMQARLAFDVAFEQGAPAYGERVVKTLIHLSQKVRAIVVQFQPEFL
jgi:hypothetical protein